MIHLEEDRAKESGLNSDYALLHDLASRIGALSAVHSLLSEKGWRPLNLSKLCNAVIRSALQSAPRTKRVELDIEPCSIEVNSDQAHHLALVYNELATNTIKHALHYRDQIRINVRFESENDRMVVEYRDDGPGYPEEIINGLHADTNIGLRLVRGIVQESLCGHLDVRNENGASVRIEFMHEPFTEKGKV